MRPLTTPRAMKLALSLASCALLLSANAHGQADVLGALTSNINIEGMETGFDPMTGVATAKGDVHIKYEDVEIKAGQAEYNANTGDVVARENVTVVKDGEIFRGENIIYNVKTEELKANSVRSSLPPIFYQTDGFKTNSGKVDRIDGTNAWFTTHDSQVQNYRIRAKSITIYPGDRVIMKGVKVYAGKTPVFWFPYIVQPLDDELGYFFQPGYTSQWGAFLLNQYGVMHGDHTLAKYTWTFAAPAASALVLTSIRKSGAKIPTLASSSFTTLTTLTLSPASTTRHVPMPWWMRIATAWASSTASTSPALRKVPGISTSISPS